MEVTGIVMAVISYSTNWRVSRTTMGCFGSPFFITLTSVLYSSTPLGRERYMPKLLIKLPFEAVGARWVERKTPNKEKV
ncbi:hypothetical protein V7056_20510 [Bacillus sp. JJ664]